MACHHSPSLSLAAQTVAIAPGSVHDGAHDQTRDAAAVHRNGRGCGGRDRGGRPGRSGFSHRSSTSCCAAARSSTERAARRSASTSGCAATRSSRSGQSPPSKPGARSTSTGLHVAPGFIDIHTHSDRTVLKYPTCDSRILQGVTTELTGNCGSCAAQLSGVDVEKRRKDWQAEDGIRADWTDVASFAARLEATKFSVNQALLLGQGTMRENAVGNVNRHLTADELDGVLRAVEEGMDQGAFGISTGLEYTPGMYTPTDEIVAMARVVARRGGALRVACP